MELMTGGPARFSCAMRDLGDQLVVEVHGDLDISTAPRLRTQLLEAHGVGRSLLIVDLCDVWFLDSTGLSVLVGAYKRARAAGRILQLVAAGNPVLKPLQVTGLHRVFRIWPSVEAALAGGA